MCEDVAFYSSDEEAPKGEVQWHTEIKYTNLKAYVGHGRRRRRTTVIPPKYQQRLCKIFEQGEAMRVERSDHYNTKCGNRRRFYRISAWVDEQDMTALVKNLSDEHKEAWATANTVYIDPIFVSEPAGIIAPTGYFRNRKVREAFDRKVIAEEIVDSHVVTTSSKLDTKNTQAPSIEEEEEEELVTPPQTSLALEDVWSVGGEDIDFTSAPSSPRKKIKKLENFEI